MLKHPAFFLFLFVFAFSGCAFLRAIDSPESEDSYAEEFEEDGEVYEGDYEDEDEDYDEEEAEEEESDDDGPGFFGRLFGFGSDDDDEESDMSDSDEEMDSGEEEAFYGDDNSGMSYDESEDSMMEDSQEGDTSVDDPMSDYTPPSSDEQASVGAVTDDSPESASATDMPAPPAEPVKAKNIPLNKILRVPYKKAGYLVNAVYIARPGDSLETVSQKIYDSPETASALREINSHLASRGLKVGDKIYYNSPLRPNDSAQLLFYWRDINAPSSFHTLSPGDNIRTVASRLLGHPNSWKEIWAVNPELESKGDISKTVNIVYWPDSSAEAVVPSPASPAQETAPALEAEKPDSQDSPLLEEAPSVPESLSEGSEGNPFSSPLEEGKAQPFDKIPPPPSLSGDELKPVLPKKKPSFLLRQKEILIALAGIAVAVFLIVRLILKKRKQRDFDYTATNIEV